MTIRTKALGLTAVAVVAALALTACSSTGGKKAAESAAAAAAGTDTGGGGGAVADTPRFTIAMVTHQAAGDTLGQGPWRSYCRGRQGQHRPQVLR